MYVIVHFIAWLSHSLLGVYLALIKYSQPNKVNKSYFKGRIKTEPRLKFWLLNVLNLMPFQKQNLHGVPVKKAETKKKGKDRPSGKETTVWYDRSKPRRQ